MKPISQNPVQHELLDVPEFLNPKKVGVSVNITEDGEYDQKATNPKDAIGSKKLGTTTVPDCVKFFCALGTIEGALKYGTANWSEAGVRCSIYLDALDRHISKFKAGEWCDRDTGVPHLSNALACIGIMLDAHLRGKMYDDRPPPNPEFVRWLDEAQESVKHLQEMFAGYDPRHYTMASIGLAPEGSLYTGPVDVELDAKQRGL